METFYIRYKTSDSKNNNKVFIAREDKNYPYHYLRADGKTHTGGGTLLKKYCTVIDSSDLSRNDILFMNGIEMISSRGDNYRKFTKGDSVINGPIDIVPTKTRMLNIFGEMVGMESWD